MTTAKTKHFISGKHIKAAGLPDHWDYDPLMDRHYIHSASTIERVYAHTAYAIGGRSQEELNGIVKENGEQIIRQLPNLTEAVRVINPDIAKLIVRRDSLLEEGKKLLEATKEVSGQIDMADIDQEMTIANFRTAIKEREKKRLALLNEMDEIGREGNTLSDKINKFLYEGLPGLSEAVIKVITDFMDRSTALEGFSRRVSEQVMFGDSDTALELLKSFEKDEVNVSVEIKAQFEEALSKLKLVGKKLRLEAKDSKSKAGKK
jgi:hypothetical protein